MKYRRTIVLNYDTVEKRTETRVSRKKRSTASKRRETKKKRKQGENRLEYVFYTDGSCLPNPGRGGWGFYGKCGEQEIVDYGGERKTTNNRMELMAAIKALKSVTEPSIITIFTDSQYLKRGIMDWINLWKKNGWITYSGQEVKNRDLWETIELLCQTHEVIWRWVRGHSGNKGNEIADNLAVKGRKGI